MFVLPRGSSFSFCIMTIRGGIVAFADARWEGEDDEATIENDDNIPTAEDDGGEDADSSVVETEREEESEDEPVLKPHPDADTFVLFTKPTGLGH
ncbi:hypothetical protein C0Q70_19677, partial [Pomacea canaliculata]